MVVTVAPKLLKVGNLTRNTAKSASVSTRKGLRRVACVPKSSRQSVVTTSKRTTTHVSPGVRSKRLPSRANAHKSLLEDPFCSRSVLKRLRRSAGLVRAAGHPCKRATTVAELLRSEKNFLHCCRTATSRLV